MASDVIYSSHVWCLGSMLISAYFDIHKLNKQTVANMMYIGNYIYKPKN